MANKVYVAGRSIGSGFNLIGNTIGNVRNILNGQVQTGMQCLVNGTTVTDSYVVRSGDEISFQKTVGTKG